MARFILGPEKEANCCYYGTVYEFLQETYSPDEWADRMQASMSFVYRMDVGRAQMESWRDCYSVCKEQLKQLINLDDKFKNMNIIFEFGLKEYHDKRPDLYYSLKSPYRKNAIWVLNDGSIRAIRKLKDLSGQYLWQPGLRQGEPDMLLGKPLYTSAYMPNIAAGAKTILFGDLSYYWIGDRKGITFKRLNERSLIS